MDASMMRKLLMAAGLCAICLNPIGAQLQPPNASGVAMGHVHLNVRDVGAHKAFWTTVGATPVRVGSAEAVKLPGMLVIFSQQAPTGPMLGSVIHHFGLKIRRLADLTPR